MADTDRQKRDRGGGAAVDDVSLSAVDPEILHLSPDERDEQGITDDEVRDTVLAVAREGDREQKNLQGVTLPSLSFDRLVIEGRDNHPLDLSDATIEGLSAEFATVEIPILLDGATIGDLALDNARIRGELSCSDATVTGEVDAFEATFDDDADFDGATFEATANFDEATFDDDASFDDATFAAPTEFRGAEFHGDSNLLDDNTTFRRATFEAEIDFHQAEFGFTHFEDATFEAHAAFEETQFDGDAEFTGATFHGRADFDEARFDEDTDFADVTFHDVVEFRGATFAGGERALEADATFEDARFHDDASFRMAKFRGVTFSGVQFDAEADFQEAVFESDADFAGVAFEGLADFDEARFGEDVDFSQATFGAKADFRGVEVEGGANYLEDDITFEGATFAADADFHNAVLTSANFMETAFGGAIDFSGSVFSEEIEFKTTRVDDDAYVDFSRASIAGGRIVQPAEGWVRYDMTLASIGDIQLETERDQDRRELLDYYRFCRTEFDEFADHEFDFSDHRDYLDRNAWVLHAFDEPPGADIDYELEMTPEIIETTYLKAKQSAAEAGDMKIAGEFRVKRQQYSRAKSMEVVRDSSVGLWPRLKNFGRATENFFLGITCGHGMRPIRIAMAFMIAPMFYVPFYAFGGSLFKTSAGQVSLSAATTPEGLATLWEIARFSYISYTTIGYGFLGPEGELAELLAASEAFLSTILAALLVYALVKRSEL